MKKIILASLLIILGFECFAQQYTSSNPQFQWGGWNSASCYKGIYFRVQKAYFNKGANQWYWNWEIQNRYNRKVAISFRFYQKGNSNNSLPDGQTSGRRTFQPNEVSSNGSFGGEQNISFLVDNVCFEFTNYNGTILDNCSSQPEIYKKGFYYADCDNGTANYKRYQGGNSNQTNNNLGNSGNNSGNNTNNQNQPSGGGGDVVNDKIAAINVNLSKIPGEDFESQAIIREATNITTNSNTSDAQKANQLAPLVDRARNRANAISATKSQEDTQAKQAQEAAQQKAKAAQEKMDNFVKYYDKGVGDLNAQNYDGAINNLQTSLSYAADAEQRTMAQNLLNKAREEKRLAAEAAARKVRVDDKLKQEEQINTQATAAMASVTALMSILNDRYDDRPVNVRAQVGLGMENIPMILNDDFKKRSVIETSLHYSILLGLKMGIANHKGISLHLNPVFYGGYNAFSQGTDGSHLAYGGFGTLQMGLKAESIFKLYAEGGWLERTGYYNYDSDAASGGTTALDIVEEGSYDYSLTRFGGGVMLHFVRGANETYIKGGVYLEKLSFAPQKPQMVGSLQINISSVMLIDFMYSKNYAIAGDADFPSSLRTTSTLLADEKNRSYFSVRLIRQGIF